MNSPLYLTSHRRVLDGRVGGTQLSRRHLKTLLVEVGVKELTCSDKGHVTYPVQLIRNRLVSDGKRPYTPTKSSQG